MSFPASLQRHSDRRNIVFRNMRCHVARNVPPQHGIANSGLCVREQIRLLATSALRPCFGGVFEAKASQWGGGVFRTKFSLRSPSRTLPHTPPWKTWRFAATTCFLFVRFPGGPPTPFTKGHPSKPPRPRDAKGSTRLRSRRLSEDPTYEINEPSGWDVWVTSALQFLLWASSE